MTIGAAENNMRRLVHVFNAAVTLEATTAFGVGFGECLVNAIARRASSGNARSLSWNRKARAECIIQVVKSGSGVEGEMNNENCK